MKQQHRRTKSPFRVLPSWSKTLIGAASAFTLLLGPIQPALAAEATNDQTLLEVYHLLLDKHYSQPTEDALLKGAVQGMLDTLDDPFTNYMSADEYQNFVKSINQQYAGIGATLEVLPEQAALRISELLPNMPAAEAGLAAGDLITDIDGVKLTKDSVNQATSKLRGKEGSQVTLGVKRGTKTWSVTVTRKAIQLPTVGSSDLGSGVAYIRITSFAEDTASEFAKVLGSVQKNQPKGLVLDLRSNGGGYVQGALEIADMFMKQGPILIVHENGQAVSLEAEPDGTDLPLTILIDGNTASASEMLAGALQKSGRAKLVGVTSYGKGTMQSPFLLPDGSELKVSIDRWALPDGTSIDRKGLTPDLRIERPDTAVNAAMQLLIPDRSQTLTMLLGKTEAKLNGTNDLTGVPAAMKASNTVYLPLRFVLETFACELKWTQGTPVISFTYNGTLFTVNTKTHAVTANGKILQAPNGVRDFNGMAYVSSEVLKAITGKAPLLNPSSVTVYSK
ncbi:S41 family peptidase [Paenibacillus sp. CAA11]|uniref:S41 family peptidase n=1 Tax=Paenibacillus sp. CAA11 TaxID=1532905 RepID=UPI00131F1C60|nr:S41 family peptidase [Paenibacillus sp. CAA11]